MSKVNTYFTDFLANIRLPDSLVQELIRAHTNLRQRLVADDLTKDLMVDSFLQGSYARSTCIKPEKDAKVDVDVIAVTNINHNDVTAKQAFEMVTPFVEKYYEEFRQQSRSIGISLEKVDMDFVITAAPSEELVREIKKANLSSAFTIEDMLESQGTNTMPILKNGMRLNETINFFNESTESSWRVEPLLLPDNDEDRWYRTHPLEQIRWTREKNKKCNGHFINVVKALKWWKRVSLPDSKYPKSYPLEHFIGECCPDYIDSVAEGIVCTMEKIARSYQQKPVLPDRGVPEHDVFGKLSEEDYQVFYDAVCQSVKIARRAYDTEDIETSVTLWRRFFADSDEFPRYVGGSGKPDSKGGFTPRKEKTEAVPTGRFAE
ncbi:SMODS domain-containing nucleotidyltransferase [Agathobaculum sp.]|uniref:SMODS domain-containing nucleotidyltransferase n=1 Tax=Agathobaculum sp. TaxID=2048138 RepID=UPI002A7F5BDC|nr:nucleotidyltransferase [Agathobaculum sp.]MDY3618788.1 nucleotidyltransferase [Agathobaculum sp.]